MYICTGGSGSPRQGGCGSHPPRPAWLPGEWRRAGPARTVSWRRRARAVERRSTAPAWWAAGCDHGGQGVLQAQEAGSRCSVLSELPRASGRDSGRGAAPQSLGAGDGRLPLQCRRIDRAAAALVRLVLMPKQPRLKLFMCYGQGFLFASFPRWTETRRRGWSGSRPARAAAIAPAS
jgi:hypothetical protein